MTQPQSNRYIPQDSCTSSPSSAGWNTNTRKPAEAHFHPIQVEPLEPFVEASTAAEFLRYSCRTIKQMAREGRIPAHPFGIGRSQEMVLPHFRACGAPSRSGKFRSWRSWS